MKYVLRGRDLRDVEWKSAAPNLEMELEMTVGIKVKMTSVGEPCVCQAVLGNLEITYNPDDERFYVSKGEETLGMFKRMSNAVYFARQQQRQNS